ncbi:MAG: amidohydrolase family protein [Myxococcales bacterium]|nr:amidohydrolase family protein [Myxococcales bacterium]
MWVDAHIHFWDPARLRYPWLSSVPSIAGPHEPQALEAETSAPPDRVVFVQAECDRSRFLEEVDWVRSLAERDGSRVAAVVAFCPMDDMGAAGAALDALRARPIVRGIRHNFQDGPDIDVARRAAFREAVIVAGRMGFSFDLCLRAPELPLAIELVAACPHTVFVLDHVGKPDIAGGRLRPWREDLAELSRYPNVVCKLSGLLTEASPGATMETLRPYVDEVLRSFGPERLLFGSDWPVVKLASSYSRWYEMARALVGHLSEREQTAIFLDNAVRTYRLT